MLEYNGRKIGLQCECCGLADVRMLTRKRLDGEAWTTLCGNCGLLAGKRKMTLAELRELRFPAGDQRQRERRGVGLRRLIPRRSDFGDRRWEPGREGDRRDDDRRAG